MSGKIYKIAFELAAKLEGSYNTNMTRALDDLVQLEHRVRNFNTVRLSGHMVRPLQESLRELEQGLREIRTSSIPNGMFSNMNTELREAAKLSKELLINLRQISTIRMPGDMFGNDMQRYLRDVQDLERRMRELQPTGGPSSGGSDGGGSGGHGGGGEIALGGGAILGGAAMAGVAGAASIGLLGAATYSFADEYSTAMAQIQASTGASSDEMSDFSRIAKNIYNQAIGEDFYDIAESMSRVEQITHQSGAELENTTKNAIAFRDTFGEDIPQSIKAADTMMKNFGVSSEQAYNLLAQGAQNGLNKSDELIDSANEYAPHFAKLGFSASEMFDTFGAGLEAGAFNLDKVGDAVKEFNIRSKDMSKTSIDAYQQLGMNAQKMSETFASGGPEAQKAFRTVAQAISSIEDPVKKNTIGVQLFGTQFEDLESGVITAMGTAQSQFDMTKETMAGITEVKYDTVGKAFQGIGRQLQTSLLLPLSNAVLPLLESFSGWMKNIGPVVQNSFGVIANAASETFQNIKWLFNNGYDGEMKGVTMNYAKALGMSDADAGVITERIASLFDQLGAIKDGLLDNWKMMLPHVQSIFGSVGKIIMQMVPIVTSIASTFGNAARNIIRALSPVITYLSGKLWPIISNIFNSLSTQVMPAIANVVASLLPKITMIGNKISEMISEVFAYVKPTLDLIFAAFNFAFPTIQSIVVNAIHAIGGVLSGLFDVLGGVIDFVTGVFTGNWAKAWEGVCEVSSGIFSSLGAVLAYPINIAIDLINRAIKGVNKIKIDVPEWLGGGSFGVNIPEIPKIGGYADGGYVTKPELAWIGEGKSNEWVIPENNSQRSRDLWQSAGASMGLTQGQEQMGNGDFNFSPTYNFYGNADQNAVQQMEQRTRSDFKQQFEAYKLQQRRVNLSY